MAHKLLEESVVEKPKKRKIYRLKLPKITGKFGVSLFTGTREVFIGIAVGEVEIERIIRKRFVKPQKGTVKVFRFD